MRGRIWLAALLFIYNLHELGIGAMGTNPTGAETAVLFKHRVHLHPRWAPIPFIARARRQWVPIPLTAMRVPIPHGLGFGAVGTNPTGARTAIVFSYVVYSNHQRVPIPPTK